jgi:hypothetical protein
MTLADEPARDEFGIRVERNPCPNTARASAASTESPRNNSVKKMKEARVKPEVTIEYCTA